MGSPMYFRSGAQEFGEPGWWKLVHNKPPTMKPEGEKLSASTLKVKGTVVIAVSTRGASQMEGKAADLRGWPCSYQAELVCCSGAVLLVNFIMIYF